MRIFSILIMLAAGAALWFYGLPLLQEEDAGTRAAAGGRLYPELVDQVDSIQRLLLERGEESIAVERGEESWGMSSKAGFPASGDAINELLLALIEAELVEEKTSNPELYGRLDVQDPGPESPSARLAVQDAAGKTLASLIVGKQREGGMAGESAWYVRRDGEEASWLVRADLELPEDESAWLDRDLVDIAATRVQAVEVRHGDGERVYGLKADESATDVEIVDIPEGKELRYASIGGNMTRGLERLSMDDVASEEVLFDNPPQAVATFWTFDGLKLEVTTQDVDGTLYGRFLASHDEAGAPGSREVTDVPSAGDPAGAEDSADGASAEAAEEGPSPAEIQAEADAINERLGSWTFVLPSWKKNTFQQRMDDLVKDIPAPEPAVLLPEADPDSALPGLLSTPQEGDGDTVEPGELPDLSEANTSGVDTEEQPEGGTGDGGDQDPDSPVTDSPVTDSPITDTPVTEATSDADPVTDDPATEPPPSDPPVTDTPADPPTDPPGDAGTGGGDGGDEPEPAPEPPVDPDDPSQSGGGGAGDGDAGNGGAGNGDGKAV